MSNALPTVTLLTRAGCGLCAVALEQLRTICADFGIEPGTIDVDEAAATDPGLRAEFGDRLPVVLLDGREHSYFDVDEPRLRADLGR
ncbi:glutaredoxin family protein [Nocardia terpenica]|uniref:Glutaredoxin family protein n=1 Tax=Nocardia terpenica TaxID=455432 RepID=A0A164JY72_9NOCA|nr:glutaredoxin family protein [Nocardia terpenica]ATL70949.1 glutaredoxin family protein [Nocardia terpenica]KZM70842.1 thiol-disulfide isomerase [Nocardia terpenica]MBF6060137.1 glutaredoxin family protein [Nocardia terpenica]MBF6103397.1 glutaredoxin family protein [Nocardia terpenica]MBF6112229.1 glutaredoxin family protein [Nocardia terpenica]